MRNSDYISAMIASHSDFNRYLAQVKQLLVRAARHPDESFETGLLLCIGRASVWHYLVPFSVRAETMSWDFLRSSIWERHRARVFKNPTR